MLGTRKLALALFVPLFLFAAIQLVPYGRSRSNPPDGPRLAFDSPATEALAKRACFDCHSNRTRWPWYASIAPVSWRIQHHVQEGREKLDFTNFDPANEHVAEAAEEASETVTKGQMPPRDYLLMHPEARLTPAEKASLAKGLDATFAAFAGNHERGAAERAAGARSLDADRRGGELAGNGEEEREEHTD